MTSTPNGWMHCFRRLLPLLVLLGGPLGVAACLGGIVFAWVVGNRLSRANDVVFVAVDRSLDAVRERFLGGQVRVQALKITTEDIRQGLQDWTRQEAGERLAAGLDIVTKAERLGAGLQEVNHYLDLATATVETVRQGMAIGGAVGAQVDTNLGDDLHEQITSLRSRMQQVTETMDEVRQGAARIAAGETLPEQLNKLVQLTLRAVATLGEMDVRLGRAAQRSSSAQARSQELNTKAFRWIVAGQVAAILVFAWLAAGQAALCVFGLRGR